MRPSGCGGAGGQLRAWALFPAALTALALCAHLHRSSLSGLGAAGSAPSLGSPPGQPPALPEQGPHRLLPLDAPGPAAPKGSGPRPLLPLPLLLLLWLWPPGASSPVEACPQLRGGPVACRLPTNHSQYRRADAVVMYHRDVCGSPQLLPPAPRPRRQHWVWFNMEPPSKHPVPAFMDHLFNLTMSYRRDSDIYAPYGWLRVLGRPQSFTIPRKSKLTALVSGKWPLGSRPASYLRQLQRHLPVDVYGRPPEALSQYRFLLAFESSLHQDYITEKLWRNALLAGAVPVVMGPPRENYERHLPPGAFIHINDFPTARELARFLQELARDPARYRHYFQWRTWLEPTVETSWAARLCRACRVLQEKANTFQAAPSLSRWFT